MREFINKGCSPRWGYDAWALKANGTILQWTASTTREEVRQIKRERFPPEQQLDMFGDPVYKIVKVIIKVEEIA